MLVIVPGPARSGIASGKIAISSGPLSSFSADCNAGRCPKSIGSAVTNSRMPPLIENACTETPRKASALCPATRKKSEIMKPSATARVASRLRSRAGRFRASEMKIGSTPNGSTKQGRECGQTKFQCRIVHGQSIAYLSNYHPGFASLPEFPRCSAPELDVARLARIKLCPSSQRQCPSRARIDEEADRTRL